MLEGMNAATQGMMAMSVKQDMITNDLANAGTTGFRKEGLVISSFSDVLNRQQQGMNGMTQAGGEVCDSSHMVAENKLYHSSSTSLTQGALKETGNPFDLALDDNGKGFFTIQTKRGIEFTRAGDFKLSTSGYLVTSDGSFVLGQHGPIKVKGTNFKVDDHGFVTVNGKKIDRLLISRFEDPQSMKRVGTTDFASSSPHVRATTDFQVKQGFVEQSNVNALQEMVSLIQVMRTFEANQKALQANNARLQKAINQVGKVN